MSRRRVEFNAGLSAVMLLLRKHTQSMVENHKKNCELSFPFASHSLCPPSCRRCRHCRFSFLCFTDFSSLYEQQCDFYLVLCARIRICVLCLESLSDDNERSCASSMEISYEIFLLETTRSLKFCLIKLSGALSCNLCCYCSSFMARQPRKLSNDGNFTNSSTKKKRARNSSQTC